MTHPDRPQTTYSRRQLLALAGGMTLAGGLAGCGIVTGSGGSGGAKAPEIKLPKSTAKLPSGKVTFGWMDSGNLKSLFEKPLFSAYHKAHPNINFNYQGVPWDTINKTVPLASRNGTLPDVFQVPQNVPEQVAINEGWAVPIDDLVPNFTALKAQYPSKAFLPGVEVFNGRTYTFTTAASNGYGNTLLFDREYMKQAGYDPVKERLTWTTFRNACKKITTRGHGQYYGLMISSDKLGGLAGALATLATGWNGMDWKTGQYTYDSPELKAAFDLLLAIKGDGSFFPGFLDQDGYKAAAQMPQRAGGMLFDGPWSVVNWETGALPGSTEPAPAAPHYGFGVAMPPYGDDRKWHAVGNQDIGTDHHFLSAKSADKEIAGELFAYMMSLDGQTRMVEYSKGTLQSMLPEANHRAKGKGGQTAADAAVLDVANQLQRITPVPQVRNADVVQVILEQKAVKPNMMDIGQGIFSGQITDIRGALRKFNDDSEKSLDDAITAAKAKGAKVSRDDWAFPNWDPSKDYTQADYAKLPKG